MQSKKRTRASHPKVRTGCHTCKARRVKCDEQRPSCLKCLSTGRKCEGYKNNREWIVVVAPPLPITDGFEDDRSRRHFDYFRSQAVNELSWFFDGDHWGRLILQESHGSAAVRHAVIALACTHEDFKDSMTVAAQAPQYAYAAQHYSKAIRNLIKETSDNAHESRLKALMCGLLFISIEILRGNNAAALNHLDGCLKIVREARERTGMPPLDGSCLESITYLFRDIIPMYARLDVQACMMLGWNPDTGPEAFMWDSSKNSLEHLPPPILSFETTFEALESLFWLGQQVHDFTAEAHSRYEDTRFTCQPRWVGSCSPHREYPDTHAKMFVLYSQILQWDHAAQILLNATESSQDYEKITLLRIHHRTMLTLLENSFAYGECHLDKFQWAFEDIINFVTELQDRSNRNDEDSSSDSDSSFTVESSSGRSIDSAPSRTTTPLPQTRPNPTRRTSRPVFVLDGGIIFSLFWTAVKCRDSLLRRRAISLLEQPWQEGVWVGATQAAIAKRVVEIEEERPYEQSLDFDMIRVAADIGEELRVHNVTSDVHKAGRTAKVTLLKKRGRWEESCEEWCESVEWVCW